MTTPDPMQPPAELAPDATVTPTPTEPHHDVRERAGRALFEHRQATNDFPPDGYTAWDDLPEDWQDEYREAADAVLAAVSAAAGPTPTEPHHDTHSRRFELHRDTDVSGVSGTGVVADGVAFPDGVVALRWRSEWPTSVVFHDRGIEGVEAVHGHGGATRLVWLDAAVSAAAPAPCPECGPGYRYGDDGCRHTPAAAPDKREALRAAIYKAIAQAVIDPELGINVLVDAATDAALAARPAPTVSGADVERAAATLAERIDGGAWADYFAAAIAPPEVLGEHSSANNPWLNALNYAETRPAPVVSGEAVERAARALYVRTARDNATHDEAVAPWSSLRSDIRSRWLDYASDALTAALGITVADAPAAEPKSPWEHPGHAPVQHRDGKAPWCDECGWSSPAGPFPAALLGEPRSTVADEGRAEA